MTKAYALPNISGLTRKTIPVQAEANARAKEVPSKIRDKNGKTYHIIKWEKVHNKVAKINYIYYVNFTKVDL